MGSSRLVFLCGLMGSGKSTIGPLVAERLQVPFLDLDREIERRVGKQVAEIFATEGEPAFRQYERAAVADVAGLAAGVVALGGGAVCDQGSLDSLLAAGTVVWLDAPVDILAGRVAASSTKRPLVENLKGSGKKVTAVRQKLEELSQARAPFYRQAHRRFDAGSQAPTELAEAMVTWLASRGRGAQ